MFVKLIDIDIKFGRLNLLFERKCKANLNVSFLMKYKLEKAFWNLE